MYLVKIPVILIKYNSQQIAAFLLTNMSSKFVQSVKQKKHCPPKYNHTHILIEFWYKEKPVVKEQFL